MFDSHAHVGAEQFDTERETVVARAREAGVSGWLEVGSNVTSSERAVSLAEATEGVLACVGIHPNEISSLGLNDWQILEKFASSNKTVAIGEIGLDFYRGGSYEQQIEVVEQAVGLALKYNKFVVWHVRGNDQVDANELLLDYIVKQTWAGKVTGIAHTFSGTVEQSRKYIDLGFKIGISGIVTFKNAGVLLDVVKVVDIKDLLIETDSPYLAPHPYRGQRNEPAYVKLVAEKIASIKGLAVEVVEEKTADNFFSLVDKVKK